MSKWLTIPWEELAPCRHIHAVRTVVCVLQHPQDGQMNSTVLTSSAKLVFTGIKIISLSCQILTAEHISKQYVCTFCCDTTTKGGQQTLGSQADGYTWMTLDSRMKNINASLLCQHLSGLLRIAILIARHLVLVVRNAAVRVAALSPCAYCKPAMLLRQTNLSGLETLHVSELHLSKL